MAESEEVPGKWIMAGRIMLKFLTVAISSTIRIVHNELPTHC